MSSAATITPTLNTATTFSSREEIQKWAATGKEITLLPGAKLVLSNVCVWKNSDWNITETPQKLIALFDRILLPSAQTVRIDIRKGDGPTELSFVEKGNETKVHSFEISFNREWNLTPIYPDILIIKIADLFHEMIESNKLNFTAGLNQKVICLDVSESEYEESEKTSLLNILERRTYSPYVPITTSPLSAAYIDNKGLLIFSPKQVSISLSKGYCFKGDPENFRQFLRSHSQPSIKPDFTLKIESDIFSCLEDEFEKIPIDYIRRPDFFIFALQHLFLSKVSFDGRISYSFSKNFLAIMNVGSSPVDFEMVSKGDLLFSVSSLYHALKSSGGKIPILDLSPEQELIVYGMNPNSIENFTDTGIQGIFNANICSLGFIWDITGKNFFCKNAGYSEKNGTKKIFCSFTPKQKSSIRATRVFSDRFVVNILNDSHPSIYKELMELNPKAFHFILLRALFYLTIEESDLSAVENYPLDNKTIQGLLNLRKKESFTRSHAEIENDSKLSSLLNEILKGDIDFFTQIDLEKLPKALKEVLSPLMGLAYNEEQGGRFISAAIRAAQRGLEGETLKPFLRFKGSSSSTEIQEKKE